jgi:GntR family transcriptional regulator/MocR family aminotransferase
MLLKINRRSPKPVYKQIIEEIKALIDQDVIGVQEPLPSTRALAKKLGVNRTTVVRAYEELQALGYLQSRPGSYNRVQKRRREVEYSPERKSLIPWEKASSEPARELYKLFLRYSPERPAGLKFNAKAINISQLDPDPRLYPIDEFRRCLRYVLKEHGPESLEYGTYKGCLPLRQLIARRLRLHGISVSEEEILITNGAQQAIDLIIRFFADRGKKVAVEAPTYANVIPLIQFNGQKIVRIPMKEDGMDLDSLERVLSREKVSFVYTIPNFQNPTGITTSHQHRERLLNICLKHKIPIVEDGFEEEMKYYGKLPLPIKSIDDKNIVIYLGTFSKALFPGLRIGWVTADRECIDRMTAIKRFSDLTSGNLVQMALYDFLNRGCYDLHLKRLHRIFRSRMQLALRTMEECFPQTIQWTRPSGGYTIWVKMPRKFSEAELHEFFCGYGVIVSPGSYYFPKTRTSAYFRISIAKMDEGEIKEGISCLGRALHKLA